MPSLSRFGRVAEPPLFDFKEARALKLFKIRADASLACPHVVGELDLPRKAGVVILGIFEKHCIRELGTNREVFFCENEIRNLSEAVPCDRIGTDDLNVAFS